MKKLLVFTCFAIAITNAVYAQDILKKTAGVATAAGFDVKRLTTGIIDKLVPALAVSSTQKPGLTSAISGFLKEKSKILSLKKTDAPAYTTKQSGLLNGLTSKLGTVLLAGQVKKFLGLKPATNDPANILSNLFY